MTFPSWIESLKAIPENSLAFAAGASVIQRTRNTTLTLIYIDTIKVNSGTKSKYTVVASPLSGVFSSSLNSKHCKSKTQPKLQFFGQSLSYDSTIPVPATQAALNDSVPEVRREAAKDRDWWDSTERGVYDFFFR